MGDAAERRLSADTKIVVTRLAEKMFQRRSKPGRPHPHGRVIIDLRQSEHRSRKRPRPDQRHPRRAPQQLS
jgi:hypothetical protein